MEERNRTAYIIIPDAGRVSEEYYFVFVFVIGCLIILAWLGFREGGWRARNRTDQSEMRLRNKQDIQVEVSSPRPSYNS